jgi:dolichol kinase
MMTTFQKRLLLFFAQQVEVERLLWTIVAMICLYRPALNGSSFAAVVTIVHLLVAPWSNRRRRRRKLQWSSLVYTSGNAGTVPRCGHTWRDEAIEESNSSRHCGNTMAGEDRPGFAMSIALVPCVLLSGIQQQHHDDPARMLCCYYYSATLSLLALLEWSPSFSDAGTVIGSALVLQGVGRGDLLWWDVDLTKLYRTMVVDVDDRVAAVPPITIVLLFLAIWWVIGSFATPSSLSSPSSWCRSLTRGEFFVTKSLTTVAATEFARYLWRRTLVATTMMLADQNGSVVFAPVAVAGVLGCVAACALVDFVPRTQQCIPWRLVVLAVSTLGTVENLLFWMVLPGREAYDFPRCLHWIFDDFLRHSETAMGPSMVPTNIGVPSRLPWLVGLPRIVWLGYWGVVMLVTIPLAPGRNNAHHPIVARKWFHFIAVLLFVPTTLYAPQLQSLSYAVALCVLLMLETTRRHVPWLNDFYVTYLDRHKHEGDETTIVSHLALIVGCAAPLWLCQWQDQCPVENRTVATTIIPLWGVYVLGVGDAMAAVVGKTFGRHPWTTTITTTSQQQQPRRTVEGSLAMALSLWGIITMFHRHQQPEDQTQRQDELLRMVGLAILLTTLLEACTYQIDNLVLPMVGYAILVSH